MDDGRLDRCTRIELTRTNIISVSKSWIKSFSSHCPQVHINRVVYDEWIAWQGVGDLLPRLYDKNCFFLAKVYPSIPSFLLLLIHFKTFVKFTVNNRHERQILRFWAERWMYLLFLFLLSIFQNNRGLLKKNFNYLLHFNIIIKIFV